MTRPKSEAEKVYKAVTPADVIPFLSRNARIVGNVVVTSAETAWSLNEYLAQRRYEAKPERRARKAEQHRAWVERNREHVRAYKREWMRRRRAA